MDDFLEKEVRYYTEINSPGYAMLVTGKWGVGKTYRLKEIIDEESRIYVSLFGVQTIDQIHAEVIAANSPRYAKLKYLFDDAARSASDVGGFFALAGAVPGVVGAFLRKNIKPGKVIIFDDLERGGVDLKDLLGVINYYVEHLGFNVVVVAHDENLQDAFKVAKEKVVGKTMRVEPDFDGAFDYFNEGRSNRSEKVFMESKRKIISNVFDLSGVGSLRVLRHVLDDLIRIRKLLKRYHLDNDKAIDCLVANFAALSLEVRSGNLSRGDLMNRREQHVTYLINKNKGGDEKSKFMEISEKYVGLDLSSDIISEDVLISILIDGRFDKDKICGDLDASSFFVNEEEFPAWYKVIRFDKLEDDVVNKADAEMERQFASGEISDIGDMVHVFGLRMMKAYNRISNKTVSEVKEENIEYIRRLLAEGALLPKDHSGDSFWRAHLGIGFWVEDGYKDEFNEVLKFLDESREEAFQKNTPELLMSLYEDVQNDPLKFYGETSVSNFGSGEYAGIPIFKAADPVLFVSAWLNGEVSGWDIVREALDNRYGNNRLLNDLASEWDWALGLLEELDRKIGLASGFARFRLERLRPATIVKMSSQKKESHIG